MTPEERDLIAGLFDRLANLENAPRDPEAERAIADGLRQAPHAVYALVQTALIQDEALKRAAARIHELEAPHANTAEPPRPAGFLDGMRDSLFGKREAPARAGSVPTVRPNDQSAPGGFRSGEPPKASVWNTGAGGYAAGAGGHPPGASGYGTGSGGYAGAPPPGAPPPPSPGGSFLGTAAAAAAGMIGGSLMLGGIRSMMGQGNQGGGHAFGGLDQAGGAARGGSPLQGGGGPGSAGGGDLARQAGIDDMGRTPASRDDAGESRRAGLFDGASDDQFQQQQIADDEEYEAANDYEDDGLGGSDGGDEQ